jgi:TolA-binding protein
VTYPQPEVIEALSQYVPLKLESGKSPELARRLNIRWLPGIAVLDADERPAHVLTGFLPPKDLLAELRFARGILAMGRKKYDEANALLQGVANEPDAERAPEAAYWWGVSRYRQTKEFDASMNGTWSLIVERWPASQWARKVSYALKKV